MADQSPQDERFHTISRFSTSSSLRRSSAVDTSMQIVPMPRWSTAVGCARFALATLFLVFTSAATAIWGSYPAFGIALFTSLASLIIFAYYFVALSCKPALYNRWVVLSLEIFGVVFWLVSFALLADWTSFHNRLWFGHGGSYGFWHASFSPSDIGLRTRDIVKRSTNKYHAGVALAGTAAVLGGAEL
ncbi:hypothetical protein A1O3_09866 [Capronia epimyces CBS 606.96]|uniref:MARVEL domain-containing protein n=1 Tax=Capronia epimyces CBS 606.96 TaxID=1182542 RepID=W9XBN5_9EURO|nr:uncharacterized protein A1O3_09866 [Capronia epimyces CBS 606.96]EXJ77638.1 hypothetical protein A1O3_09866 [Capronia epimyces CBS 606.96]